MKKTLTFLLLIAGIVSFAQTQYSAKDFFTEKKIIWYGIDYSHARFVGNFAQFKDAGTLDGRALVEKYFPGWNTVIQHEPEKYDVAKAFHKDVATIDLTAVTKVNSETKPDGIMTEEDYTLSESELPAIIGKYKSDKQSDGIGVVFVTEAYNRTKETGSYYVVIFDIASNKILISQKYSEKPGGFGIKNYWISTVRKTFEEVDGGYKKWQKTYGK